VGIVVFSFWTDVLIVERKDSCFRTQPWSLF